MKNRIEINKRATYRPRVVLTLCLGLILLVTSAISPPAAATQTAQAGTALVRVEAPGDGAFSALVKLETTILSHLYGQGGKEYLLLTADLPERERINQAGLEVAVLDRDSHGATYYLATWLGEPPPARLDWYARVLYEDIHQAVIRTAPRQVQVIQAQGYHLKRLSPHPLTIPEQPALLLPADITPNPVVQEVVNRISTYMVSDYDGGLSGEWPVNIGGSPYTIATRYTPADTPIEKATQYAYERFDSFGLEVSYHSYDLSGSGGHRNVIAEQPGLLDPAKIVMITAHLDSYSNDPFNLAPGADDNASGSTAVLIAAQLLSQYQFDYTLRYALFTGEEQGLIGSQAYAEDARNQGDDIIGVVNLDMIGYNSDNAAIFGLHTRPNNDADQAIANLFAQVIPAYGISLTPLIQPSGIQASDHASFWDVGYAAIMGIEDLDDFTPYYHTTEDRLSTLDLFYFTNNVKASVATIAHMGGIRPPPGVLTGLVYDSLTDQPIPGASVTATIPEADQQSTTTDQQGRYRISLEAGSYMVTASAADYQPLTFNDIQIEDNHTTALDFPLDRCYPVQDLDFTYSPPDALAGEPLTFTATVATSSTAPINYRWDFGDGGYGIRNNVSHTYIISDVYTVTLTATNCAGTVSHSEMVEVTGYPEIEISPTVIATSLDPGSTVTNRLEIRNPGADELTWSLSQHPERLWLEASSQDGLLPPQESEHIALVFTAPPDEGYFTTTLQIDSNDSTDPHITIPVTMTSIFVPLQGAQILYSPLDPRTGENIVFTGTVTAGSQPISYSWDFGDGSAASGAHVSHTYAVSGTYSLSLHISNPVGSVEVSAFIPVTPAPECSPVTGVEINYTPVHPRIGESVIFSAAIESGTPPLNYVWDFGDGSPPIRVSDLAAVSHVFPYSSTPETYQVELSLTNDCSGPLTVQITVTIDPMSLYLPLVQARSTPADQATYRLPSSR